MQVQAIEVDAFGADAAVGKGASSIVVPTSQSQPQFCHVGLLMTGIIPG